MVHIRMKTMQLVEADDKLLKTYEEDILPCESFEEFCDAAELLDSIPDPQLFLTQTLQLSSYDSRVQE